MVEVVDRPPAECCTVTPTLPIVPVAVVEVTLLQVDQYNPCDVHNEFWILNWATLLTVPETATFRVVALVDVTVTLPFLAPAVTLEASLT